MLLDNLRMRRRLLEAGFPDQQADALTEEIANIVTGELATKADLRELRNEMADRFGAVQSEITDTRNEVIVVKGEIAGVRVELQGEIVAFRAELQGEIADVRNEIAGVKGEIANIRNEIADVRNEVADLKVSIADFKTSFAKWGVGLAVAVLLGFAGMSVAIVLSLARIAG